MENVMNFEQEFDLEQKECKRNLFINKIEKYDEDQIPIMRDKGYCSKGFVEKTAHFLSGTITYKRRRWSKDGESCYPVDEYIGLEKRQRVSEEVFKRICYYLPKSTYRDIAETFRDNDIDISHFVVFKARQWATHLMEEREAYRYYEEIELHEKINAKIIYLEADGLMIKTSCRSEQRKHTDYSHYVLHTGKRGKKIENFVEFYDTQTSKAKEQLIDYIYNHFEITPDTLLYTRSDGGIGYTASVFHSLAKEIGIARGNHHYFWDRWHVFRYIHDQTKTFPEEIHSLFIDAINSHSHDKLHLALDTMESLLVSEESEERFESFKKRMLSNFRYTHKALQRGLSHRDIPVIEANHKKVTHRMKHRGMYWSIDGALTVIRIIVMKKLGILKELFDGDWREEYAKYQEIENVKFSKGQSQYQGRQAHYISKRRPPQTI